MTDPNRQPTCAKRVEQAWQSQRDSLTAMLDPKPEHLTIESHAPNDSQIIFDGDHEIAWLSNDEIREYAERFIDPSDLADFPDDPADRRQWPPELLSNVLAEIFEDWEPEIREAASEAFNEYGLAFDYVAPNTFPDQNEGYWRYQISWGGPSEEIRFYASPGPNTGDFTVYRAEFWHLDWFDGAPVDVTHEPVTRLLWDEFHDTGTVDAVMRDALD